MCGFGTKNPLIRVIALDERASKHVGSRTPPAMRAFWLMVLYVLRQTDARGDQALPVHADINALRKLSEC